MSVDAIIFDLDGTLINSIPAHKKLLIELGKKYGVNITEKDLEEINGMKRREGFAYLKKKKGFSVSVITMIKEARKLREEVFKNITLFPKTKTVLNKLSKKYRLALATSSTKFYAQKNLSRFGLADFFLVVVTANNVKKSKPSPDIFLKAAQKINVLPKNCVVIEDAPNGVIAAKRANMKCIAVLTSTKKSSFVKEAKPDKFISSLEELPLLLKEKSF